MATDGSAMDRLFEEQSKNEWMKENWWILDHAKEVNYSFLRIYSTVKSI